MTDIIDAAMALALPGKKLTFAEKLTQIDTLKSWLDYFQPLPNDYREEIEPLYDIRFTYNSNAIEGNTLTQSETELVLQKGIAIGGKTLIDHLEVIGHDQAIDYIRDMAAMDTLIGEWEIRQIHALIQRGVDLVTWKTDSGRYRTQDVQSAGTGHMYPPHYEIPERMRDFAAWLSSDEASHLHAVERASEAHYRFVAIHPFQDGNGRTGRLLMNLLLLRDGYPIAIILKAARERYIDALIHAQSHNGDVSLLTSLIAVTCRAALIEYLTYLPREYKQKAPFSRLMFEFFNLEDTSVWA